MKFLELLRVITASANSASTVEGAMQTAIDEVCKLTRWPIGHLYQTTKDSPYVLQPTDLWHFDDPERFENFRRVTMATSFSSGLGLPGRVLQSGRPAWINDVISDPNFPRAKLADDLGIRAGFAFPILAGTEVAGVLEFFSPIAEEPNRRLLEVMADVGTQLGRVVERQRAEEALRQSELKFRSVAQSAIDAIISADRDGNISFWNNGARRIFGYSEKEVLGKPLTMLMPQRYRGSHQKGIKRLSSTGETHVIGKTLELHGRRKDGDEFPLELSLSTWETSEGPFYSGIIRDITERKRIEQEIKLLNADLERRVAERVLALSAIQAQLQAANQELQLEIAERKRLEQQKDEFIASASHELRTPISTIKGYTQLNLLHATRSGDERLVRTLRIIDEKADLLTRLIDELLDVSRIQSGVLELHRDPFDLGQLAQDVVGSLRLSAPEFIITVNRPGSPVIVNADQQRIEQVVTNLVQNAIRYSSANQKIEVSVERGLADGEVITTVRDFGIGIPAEQQSRVFERFFRAGNVSAVHISGLGLGLYIANDIVARHQGRIWVESAEGVGSSFYFTLPLAGPATR